MQYQVFVQNESKQHFVIFDDFMEKLSIIRKQSNAVVDE